MIVARHWRNVVRTQTNDEIKVSSGISKVILMTNNEDNVYKSNANIREEIKSDLEANIDKFKDPLVLAELVYKLLEERENTNRILKNILAKLEAMEAPQQTQERSTDVLLPEIDEEILQYVQETGKATAKDVQQRFNYKGSNAASARMNRLYEQGLLEKRQVGRKIYFLSKA